MSLKEKYPPRMSPNDPKKLNVKRTFLVGLGFMTAMVAWSYYNFTVPLILNEVLPDVIFLGFMGKDTLIGIIMTLDNIVAVLFQPYFGALSDRTSSKYGRRMPFVLIGCTIGAITFSLIPYMRVVSGLILVIMTFNFAMAFYRAPVVSLMPDVTPPTVRSTGNAIINLMGGFGTVIAYATPMIAAMVSGSDTISEIYKSRIFGFSFIAAVMIIAMIALFLTIKETPTGDHFFKIAKTPFKIDPITLEHMDLKSTDPGISDESSSSKWSDLQEVFRAEEKSALFMLLAIFSWFFGFNAIEAFYSNYATKYLGWKEANASLILLLLPIMLIIFAIPNGKLAEKIGRIKTMRIGLMGVIFCILVLTFMRNMIVVAIFLALAGIFWGMVNINSIAVIWQLAPKGKIGSYTGLYYTFSQLAAILSPIFAGLSFDAYKKLKPDLVLGEQYLLLFPYVLTFMIIAFLFLMKVKRGEATDNLSEEELRELQEKYGDID